MLSLRIKISIFCYSENKDPLLSAENNQPVLLPVGHNLFCCLVQGALVLARGGGIDLVVVMWWSSTAIRYCDYDCVKGMASARMSFGQIKMQ